MDSSRNCPQPGAGVTCGLDLGVPLDDVEGWAKVKPQVSRRLVLCGLYECLGEAGTVIVDRCLGVPLDAQREPSAGVFDRLDHAVTGDGSDPQVAAELAHGLVMLGYDVDIATVDRSRGALASCLDRVQSGFVARRGGAVEYHVLEEGATRGDVQELVAAADADVGDVERQHRRDHRQVRSVAGEVHLATQAARSFAIETRMNVVVGARKYESVRERQLARGWLIGDQPYSGARTLSQRT